jgi:hypothetical protein
MRPQKVIILLVLPFVFQVFGSCWCDCECDNVETSHYTFQSIAVQHLDNSGPSPVTASGQVLKHAYGIGVTINREQTARVEPIPCNFSFFQSAYANDCVSGEYVAVDTISTFKIFSLADFDETHPANSDISAYFKISNLNGYTALDDYVDVYGASTIYNPGELQNELQILLMTPPTLGTTHQFKVEIVLTDGTVIEKTTTSIDLVE